MICSLSGRITRLSIGEVAIDVHGVGYLVRVTPAAYDEMTDGAETLVWTSTYVREDRLELYGFLDSTSRLLFETLLGVSGIGPKLALEITAIPRSLLRDAVTLDDASILAKVKGIGQKRAEKLLVDLVSLHEKNPSLFSAGDEHAKGVNDDDAVTALASLGYDRALIERTLRKLPKNLTRTEDRVKEALKTL